MKTVIHYIILEGKTHQINQITTTKQIMTNELKWLEMA